MTTSTGAVTGTGSAPVLVRRLLDDAESLAGLVSLRLLTLEGAQ